MLDHLEISTRRLDETVDFYARVLAPLGYALKVEAPSKGFGDGEGLDFFIGEGPPSADVHFAFRARDRATVRACWDAGATASSDRPPALMPQIHPTYYAGFLRDPDGRLIEFACHAAED
jgi:catechol 2,3-dioxygenase-like lactoylglutathione lyase family enzyme